MGTWSRRKEAGFSMKTVVSLVKGGKHLHGPLSHFFSIAIKPNVSPQMASSIIPSFLECSFFLIVIPESSSCQCTGQIYLHKTYSSSDSLFGAPPRLGPPKPLERGAFGKCSIISMAGSLSAWIAVFSISAHAHKCTSSGMAMFAYCILRYFTASTTNTPFPAETCHRTNLKASPFLDANPPLILATFPLLHAFTSLIFYKSKDASIPLLVDMIGLSRLSRRENRLADSGTMDERYTIM